MFIKLYFIALSVFLAIDMIWLGLIAKNFYAKQIGFLMKSEAESGDNTIDTKDAYKSIDFGLGVGLAYDLPMGLFVGARYNLGLSKVNEDVSVGDISVETDDIKNGVIQVGVGYKF